MLTKIESDVITIYLYISETNKEQPKPKETTTQRFTKSTPKETTTQRFTKSTARRQTKKEQNIEAPKEKQPKKSPKKIFEKEQNIEVPKEKQPRKSPRKISEKANMDVSIMCSLGALLSIIQGFNTIQKDCVKQIGFGALSLYVVDKFDPTKIKIVLQERVEIDVTKESFSKLPFRKENDKCYDEWTEQFENKKMIRLHEIKMNIVTSDNTNMNFQMNFIALLINSLIESSSCGKANTYPLNYIMKNTNISNIDWYSYLLNCLVKTKRYFDSSNPTNNFVGPFAFLVLLYVDRVHCSKTTSYLSLDIRKMKLREIYEKEIIKQFGTGDLNEDFVEEDINQEDYEQMIFMKIRKINLLIENGINNFPTSVILNHLKSMLGEFFNDEDQIAQEDNKNNDDDDDDYDDEDDDDDEDN
uniref:Uncharacterized protein n=1 Tax=Lactuca sativa TaxID=4236 RepID=A0A9R1XQW7_LACSA|nr:hypothetical protein LSAT_V11C300128930 [Lactuca sativa]